MTVGWDTLAKSCLELKLESSESKYIILLM